MSPLLAKLRFKPGMRVYVAGAPAGYEAELAATGHDIERRTRLPGRADLDLAHAFFTRKAHLVRDVPKLVRALKPGGLLWLSYPKGSQLATDLNRDILRREVESLGLDTVALVAIDEVWAAVRCKAVD
jgi:hypothetical protein